MTRRLILGLAPMALALATVANAQPPAPHHEGGPPEMRHADMKAMHEAMMKQHLEDLKVILRLRPDQEPALQAFAAAHHPPEMGEMHDKMFGGPEAKPMTTPERLDDMAKHEAAMAAEHQKMAQALKTFYAALSPDQQKVFDALQRMQGPMGLHGGHHMMVMMGGPGMMMGAPGMMDGGPRTMIIRRHEGPPTPGDDQ
jgi:hypothetical protein